MGLRAGWREPVRSARAAACRHAVSLRGHGAGIVSLPQRHAARGCRAEPSERPGARALLRARLARDHALNASRRQFLSAALIGLTRKTDRAVAGGFVDDSHTLGHKLRDRAAFPAARQTVKI